MDSFIFVLPTTVTRNSLPDPGRKKAAWFEQESQRAIQEWRRHFRGEPRVIKDTEVTAEHIASANLVLWGDLDSNANAYLGKIADRLPIKWTGPSLSVGQQKFASTNHIPALIYPNPENPNRYIVLNSGFTFREYDYLNNARQIAKLPDYAIIDITVPPNSRYPGKIVTAGFFDEQWQLRSE
jgi:hypothetical protein